MNRYGLALAFFASVALAGNASRSAAPHEVNIDNFTFAPKELTVPVGATVTWTNHDGDIHSVVATGDPKTFKSPAMDTGDTFSFTFAEAGTYAYLCSLHPHMTGTIIVK